jgi:ABC-type antimicrobial peptide transport system permease subunit
LYGVTSFLVARRTREFGIRMALGARARDVALMVIGQGARLAAVGIVLGVAGAWMLTRLLGGLLYEVSARDPATFVGVSLLLLAVVMVASYVPASRAARMDPVTALRRE